MSYFSTLGQLGIVFLLSLAGCGPAVVDGGGGGDHLDDAYAHCPADDGAGTTYPLGQKSIAVDATHIYWTETGNWGSSGYNGDGRVMKMPIAGGEPIVLAKGEMVPEHIAVDATHVYWSTENEIRKIPLDGGNIVKLADQVGTQSLVVDATHVYFSGKNVVKKVPLDGGEATILASDPDPFNQYFGIAVDADFVYFTNLGKDVYIPDGTITKVPLGGGTPTILASGQSFPYRVAVDATDVYWTNKGFNDDIVNVSKVSLNGGVPKILVSGTAAPPTNHDEFAGIAIDASYVYYTSHGTAANQYQDGALMRVPLNGGTPHAVEADLEYLLPSFVLNGCNIYYISYGGLHRHVLP